MEVERNVSRQLGREAVDRYHAQLETSSLNVVPVPSTRTSLYAAVVGEKDAHVVGAAVAGNAQFLITLDKRLATRVNEADLGVRALSPGDFIKGILPEHDDFHSIR